MDASLPMHIEPNVKEEPLLTASASSSSRLSNLSSSSRRLRHISPPPPESQSEFHKKWPGTSQSHATQPTYPETLWPTSSISLPTSNDQVQAHRFLPKLSAATQQTCKMTRSLFLLWKWICLVYFFIVLLDALRHFVTHSRDTLPVELLDSPELILSALPLEHRLSKLSSLYPIPISLEPFVLGPRTQGENLTVACAWTSEADISQVQLWTSSWLGPVSMLVTTSAPANSLPHNELLSRLASLSELAPNISFHVLHTPSSLRNSNAYINLARLFSPSKTVVLFPPISSTLRTLPPRSSSTFLEALSTRNEQLMIPMLPLELSDDTKVDMSHNTFLATSALLLDRDNAPWCTERLFTITDQTRNKRSQQPLVSDVEMTIQWQECVWNIWLRSHGMIRLLDGEGWAISGAQPVSLQPESLPETIETNLRARLARKQRSETCFLVARELIALEGWFEMTPTPPQDNSSPSLPRASGDMKDAWGGTTNESSDGIKQNPTESTQAAWFREVCPETFERWGMELIVD